MSSPEPHARRDRPRWLRVLGAIVYWLAVLAVSAALVLGLILLLESRDESSLEDGSSYAPPDPSRRANTTMRLLAL